jgi:hypothetical protein
MDKTDINNGGLQEIIAETLLRESYIFLAWKAKRSRRI